MFLPLSFLCFLLVILVVVKYTAVQLWATSSWTVENITEITEFPNLFSRSQYTQLLASTVPLLLLKQPCAIECRIVKNWVCCLLFNNTEGLWDQSSCSKLLTLSYTPYGWTAMHWLWKITQQNIMKWEKSGFLPTLLNFCLLLKKIVVMSI